MKLLDFIYPKRCLLCDEIQNVFDDSIICSSCLKDISYLKAEPIIKDVKGMDAFYCIFKYEKPVSDGILKLKFNNRPEKGIGFGTIIARYIKINVSDYKGYVICSVPLGKKRKKERRYNQSDIMAGQAAKILNIPYLKKISIRSKETAAQSTLGQMERIINVKGCFFIKHPDRIVNKNIIIVDDVITTGSTLNELALELKKNGAMTVIGVSIAGADT